MAKRRTSAEVKADNELIDRIYQSLEENPKAVCKAILMIHANQTMEERNQHATLMNNGVGFTSADADFGTFLAGVIQKEGQLKGKLLNAGRRVAKKYAKTQLFQAAKNKQLKSIEIKK